MIEHDIIIERHNYGIMTTLGVLKYKKGGFECYTLEDIVRGNGIKVPEFTAIPEGDDYIIEVTWSPKYRKDMPLIYNTHRDKSITKDNIHFSGVRIHGGNRHIDSEGCVLVAYKKGVEQSQIRINGNIINMNDNIVWDSASDDFVNLLKKGDKYTTKIVNIL